ncbi:LPD1 domain-containing protein [Paenibacillus ihuae]|uniref:LPD1 domain-containing protein n=1 Tax=Paenibacillus ihuae TaxID=1232431 RepID=UPI0006D58DF4|nr:LPD1 domain-containing protein [Paenibacillus ihuae]
MSTEQIKFSLFDYFSGSSVGIAEVVSTQLEKNREVPKGFFIPTDFSSFFLDAKGREPYWSRDHDLFARAFEDWIEDELVERGMTNSYLVSGTRYGGPYPQSKERETINEVFRAWWHILLDSGILQNEGTWKRG